MKVLNMMIMSASVAAAMAAASCATAKKPEAPQAVQPAPLQPALTGGRPAAEAMPKATVYRMTGNATAANVPVQVDARGNIVSFPAPTDVRGQEPIALGNGYLLDRRGVNEDSRFTRYTYAEYAALKSAPTLAELKAAIIPGARVTDLRRLDMTPAEAAADTAAVVRLLGADRVMPVVRQVVR